MTKNNKALYKFLFKAAVLFVVWNVLYYSWITTDTGIEMWLTSKTAWATTEVFELFGFEASYLDKPGVSGDQSSSLLFIDGQAKLSIADNCNALTLIALFVGFILAYPGSWKYRLWFIPLGAVLIFLINVLRAVSLVFIYMFYHSGVFHFHHKYTFTIAVYLCVFGLWMLWANRYSHRQLVTKAPNQKMTV